MFKKNIQIDGDPLLILRNSVKRLIEAEKYEEGKKLIAQVMTQYPHSPEPHNLFGIILESEGDHLTAMKHFRAAWSLDPTYIPARCNLERYSSFFSQGAMAYDENDCAPEKQADLFKVEYDECGVGHIVRRE